MKILTPPRVLCATMAMVFIFLAASGGLTPVISLDTSGHLAPWTWGSGIWGARRGPLFGYLMAPFGDDFSLLPTLLLGLFFSTLYYLYRNLVIFGVSQRAALALTLPLLISNSLLRYEREVHVEFPAIILLLLSLSLIVRLQDVGNRKLWCWLAYMSALGTSYLIRPSFLPVMFVMPALFIAMGHLKTKRWQVGPFTVLLLLSIAPFLIVSTIRYQTVDDFNTVSFGGFNMTGLTSAILTEKIIPKLRPDNRDLARDILNGRDAMVRRGEICPMVIDYDKRERSFRRTARSYFDILANNFDEVAYRVVVPLRKPGESWVKFNQRMMSFCLDVIRAAPFDYGMWVLGATRSTIGTATVLNFPFVLGFSALLIIYLYLVFFSELPAVRFPPLDIPVIVLITVLISLACGILPILVAYPIIRYVSTSALFLPSLLFYLVIQLSCEYRYAAIRQHS